jgi:hypothetical protein
MRNFLTLLLATAAPFLACTSATAQKLRVDHSIVDYLKSQKSDWSEAARKGYWKSTFPDEKQPYVGTMVQNMRLLEALRIKTKPLPEACKIPQDLSKPIKDLKLLAIDRRSKAGRLEEGGYFVIFSSRAATGANPGHAWVSFALSEEETAQQCVARTFGNFPNKGEKAWKFGLVPGGLVESWAKNRDDHKEAHRMIVRVDSEAYVKARSVLEKWAARKEYQLLKLDCTHFAKEVAAEIGLKVNSSKFPNVFISELIKDNKPEK